jgi:hypothetical protein
MQEYNNYLGGTSFGVPASSSQPTGTGSSGSSLSTWTALGGNLISGGLNYFGKQKEADAIRAQADALRAKGASEVEVAKLMLEAKRIELEQAKIGGGAKTGSSALYIGLGVGAVVILGVVIFAVTRKKA